MDHFAKYLAPINVIGKIILQKGLDHAQAQTVNVRNAKKDILELIVVSYVQIYVQINYVTNSQENA